MKVEMAEVRKCQVVAEGRGCLVRGQQKEVWVGGRLQDASEAGMKKRVG